MAKRINHNNLLPWFTEDHGRLPKAYLKSCRKFFEELGIKTKTNELQAASFKRQAITKKEERIGWITRGYEDKPQAASDKLPHTKTKKES